jgi:hypothetical protein
MTEGTVCVEAGALIRGYIRRALIALAAQDGLEIKVQEDKRWFKSVYFFTVSGTDEKVTQFLDDAVKFARGI